MKHLVLRVAFLALGLSAPAATLPAQVPDGQLVVSAFDLPPTWPGAAGLCFVDPVSGAVTAVSGLPCELTASCNASSGSNCVVRDPRSERLLVGNLVINGGEVKAWLL
ncbi:MAG: hypothetical protein ABIP94_25655, partial [Planctomycetota bacterium]